MVVHIHIQHDVAVAAATATRRDIDTARGQSSAHDAPRFGLPPSREYSDSAFIVTIICAQNQDPFHRAI